MGDYCLADNRHLSFNLFKSIPKMKNIALLTLLFIAFPLVRAATAQNSFDLDHVETIENKSPEPTIAFKYRLMKPDQITNTVVTIDGKNIDFHSTPYADNPLNISSVLILVDTSSGSSRHPRAHTLELNKSTILDLLTQTTPRNLVGLYSFDNDIYEKSPIGSSFSETRTKLKALKADGVGTRMYRRAMDAVEKIKSIKSNRKAIVLFSDGKDEDTGFNLDDLIKIANENKIIFVTVGCAENVQGLPSLGNLEKLAAKTGGLYVQLPMAEENSDIIIKNPENLARNILATIDSGGEVIMNANEIKPESVVQIKLNTKNGEVLTRTIDHTKTLIASATPSPTATASATPTPKATPSPTATASPSATPTASPTPTGFSDKAKAIKLAVFKWLESNPWSVVAAVALILIISGIVISVLKKSKRNRISMEATKVLNIPLNIHRSSSSDVYGWLVIQDSQSSQQAIKKTANTIGRRADNDIVFANDSVSGHHAEIHMGRDGAFTITDLNSGNGTIVNGKRITQSSLSDGDLIEIGEVRFTFKKNA